MRVRPELELSVALTRVIVVAVIVARLPVTECGEALKLVEVVRAADMAVALSAPIRVDTGVTGKPVADSRKSWATTFKELKRTSMQVENDGRCMMKMLRERKGALCRKKLEV